MSGRGFPKNTVAYLQLKEESSHMVKKVYPCSILQNVGLDSVLIGGSEIPLQKGDSKLPGTAPSWLTLH